LIGSIATPTALPSGRQFLVARITPVPSHDLPARFGPNSIEQIRWKELMEEPLRIAFVGCGGVAAHYLSVYAACDWARVAVCIDADPAVAARAALQLTTARHPRAPRVTTEFAAALAPEIAIVVINTPNHLHREQALAAIEAGKHVLLQKPLAADIEDAAALCRAAETARGVCGLYLSYFDQPLMYDLREMLAAGWFGDAAHFAARLMHRGGLAWSDAALAGQPTWRSSLALTGGGCFIQLAVHYIHLFRWLSGAQVARVMAIRRNRHCPGLEGEDLAIALLEFDNGALATLETAWCAGGEQLAIHGTRGSVVYLNNRWLSLDSGAGPYQGRVIAAPSTGDSAAPLELLPPALGDSTNPLNQHRRFLEAVRDGLPAPVSFSSGLTDMRVVRAFYESAQTGCAVQPESGGTA
jgi:predicted dehydrogenase